MRVAIACIVAALAAGATAGAAAGLQPPSGSGGGTGASAHLKLTDTSPVTIRGTGFRRHERVRVRVQGGGSTALHKVRATRSGSFRTTFKSVDLSRPCSLYVIRATGGGGSEAKLQRHPVPGCIAD